MTPTPRYSGIITAARQAAHDRGHPYLGVEHLMLVILDGGASVAAHAIHETGTSLADVRARLNTIIAGYEQPLRREGDTPSAASTSVPDPPGTARSSPAAESGRPAAPATGPVEPALPHGFERRSTATSSTTRPTR